MCELDELNNLLDALETSAQDVGEALGEGDIQMANAISDRVTSDREDIVNLFSRNWCEKPLTN